MNKTTEIQKANPIDPLGQKTTFGQEVAHALSTVRAKRCKRRLFRLLRWGTHHAAYWKSDWIESFHEKRTPHRRKTNGTEVLIDQRTSQVTGSESVIVPSGSEYSVPREQAAPVTSSSLLDYGLAPSFEGRNLPHPQGLNIESELEKELEVVQKTEEILTETLGISERFELAVDLLAESRRVKEHALRKRKRNVKALDELDRLEEVASSTLFGIFSYSLGVQDLPIPLKFDKKVWDDQVENMFGSLDVDGEFGPGDRLDAGVLFSLYLSRKVWSPVHWRKFDQALDGFYERVCTPRDAPADPQAIRIGERIIKLLMKYGPPFEDFIKEEPNSASACLEANRLEGGKRNFLYGWPEQGRVAATIKVEAYGFDFVVPIAIYTGGKIRVITVGSALTNIYLWVNHWLSACFRRLPCSIFGGEVSSWYEIVKKEFKPAAGETIISGDLQEATDRFRRALSAAMIDCVCEHTGMSSEDAMNMKRFTTHCAFRPTKDAHPSTTIYQQEGQMMGSEISFPMLCIISLVAYLYDHPQLPSLFQSDRKSYMFLKSLKKVGINGDDIVFIAPNADSWVRGVEAVGGIVSRGKSLSNPYFFTVNSELWSTDGQIFVARPSTLTALNDGVKYFMNPTKDWLEYSRCDLFVHKVFNLESRLRVNLPVRWGGLGLVRDFNPFQCALAKLQQEARRAAQAKQKWFGRRIAVEEALEKNKLLQSLGPKVEVLISRESLKAYQRVYFSQRAIWKRPVHMDDDPNLIAHARHLAWIDREALKREYELLMCPRNMTVARIPATLVKTYYATPVDKGAYAAALPRTYPDFVPIGIEKTRLLTFYETARSYSSPFSDASRPEIGNRKVPSDHYFSLSIPETVGPETLISWWRRRVRS